MIAKSIKSTVRLLNQQPRYYLLDHHKMEELKTRLFSQNQKTKLLKLKFLLKQAKYTIVQGSKDLWRDSKWMINLHKNKTKQYFTGYELAKNQRVKIDMIKFIPYSVILVVPFAELALPLILWLFPNAVPSFYLFDTAMDQRIQKYQKVQQQSHSMLIDMLTDVMSKKLKTQSFQFSRYQFFKEDFFQIIDDLDQHLSYKNFNSDQLIKVLQFMGGGDFVTGVQTFNKIINLFTMNIPRVTYKILRWLYAKIMKKTLEPYSDPFFVKGYFQIFKFNYFPFEYFKRKFLLWQIDRKFRMIWQQDKAFDQFGMDDVIGKDIKQFARERGLATLSCYETLKNVIKNDWVKFTTHPKFKNNNTKLWYSVMMYNFLKESSKDIN